LSSMLRSLLRRALLPSPVLQTAGTGREGAVILLWGKGL
jgi:hypothetical protein